MSLLKKIFGTLTEKPWEQDQAVIDSGHSGKTFEKQCFSMSKQKRKIRNTQ